MKRFGQKKGVLILLLGLLLLPACSGGRPVMTGLRPRALKESLSPLGTGYRLGPGDLLSISFISRPLPEGQPYRMQVGDTLLMECHGNEHLNRNLIVRPDGRVTIPYAGEVRALDAEPMVLAREIREIYRQKRIFSGMEITLSVVGFNSRLRELQSAITTADGGIRKSISLAQDGTIQAPLLEPLPAYNLSVEALREKLQEAYGRVLPAAAVMVDLQEVRSNYVYVIGEVLRPGLIPLGGRATVTQVIAQAGGYRETAGLSSVVLLHPDEDNRPRARLINLNRILTKGDLSQDALVSRYDIIYVPPSVIHALNQAVLMGIRRMLPVDTHASVGFSYVWGNTEYFRPF